MIAGAKKKDEPISGCKKYRKARGTEAGGQTPTDLRDSLIVKRL
jgi:hypothetical protein